MKKLRVKPRLGSGNIKLIERAIEHQLPENFKEFMVSNAGLSHYECIYTDKENRKWEVSQYNQYKDLIGLAREFKKNGWGIKVSFAYDPGGWHYCLSFDEDTFGKIMVNRWTDHSPEDQFLIIADNFEDFINGLEERKEDLV